MADITQTPAPGRIKRFGVNVLSSLAARLIGITVLVWVNQHLLRRIAPEEYSLFPLVMSLVIFSSLFVTIFMGGVSRYIVEADARDDQEGVTRLVSSMLLVLVPAALALALLGALASWRIDLLLDVPPGYLSEARVMLFLTVLPLCLTMVSAPLAQGLYVRERFVTDNVVQLLCEALRIVLLLALMYFAGTRVVWLVVASSVAAVVYQVVLVVLTRELMAAARFERRLVCRATMKTVLSFGAWTSVQGLAQLVSRASPILILNRFATPFDVAVFHVGRLPEQQIRSMLQAFEGPAQPAMIGIFARDGLDAIHTLYYRGGRYYLWLTLFLVAPALVFAQPLFRLYAGNGYAEAGLVMAAFLASFPFLFASGMYYRVAHTIGRIGAFNTYMVVVQLATLVALYYAVAIRAEGALGAALAIGVTQALLHVLMIWPLGLRLVRGNWSQFARKTLARGLLPFAAALATCLLLARFLEVDSWWELGWVSAVALLVYVGTLLLGCLDELDRSLLERGLRLVGLPCPRRFRSEPGA